ncbi:hypothetical protein [Mucilaginibacter sp. dw_454]|uniref:hypothetical protein n=1 Tax=Mucilaginibacter sp. dw_454 TaxID=2720079 RepID=UPI001BD3A273|nr:hypothetical protein [Mucilaginibacter sp. dw_454]
MNKVTLQINLAPVDYPHAVQILPHQLAMLSGQVDEILLTVDTRKGKGRFAEGWLKYQQLFNDFLEQNISTKYPVTILPVDYSAPAKQQIAKAFFEGNYIPDRDFRGGPFYVYFFGLHAAKNNVVFHLDSDVFLGGGSQTWINEALAKLAADDNCFVVSPLPGPPHPEGILISQPDSKRVSANAYVFEGMSTRIFMLDKSRFEKTKLHLQKPSLRNRVKALVEGNPPADLPEHIISTYMRKHSLKRIDFLGEGNGMWSLHPPFRTKGFYEDLPQIIKRVEENCLPKAQLGFYDVVDDVCDWAEARNKLAANRWYKRLFN